jgi:hypothetical protein
MDAVDSRDGREVVLAMAPLRVSPGLSVEAGGKYKLTDGHRA